MVSTATGGLGLSLPMESGASMLTGLGVTVGAHSFRGGVYLGTFNSQALSGGATLGTLASESFSGGAYVTSFPLQIGQDTGNDSQNMGFWLQFGSLPASDMTLFDFDGGAAGYYRCKLSSSGQAGIEVSLQGTVLSITNSLTMSTGTWYWFSCPIFTHSNPPLVLAIDLVITPAGGSPTTANTTGSAAFTNGSTSTRMGFGVSLSSSYLNFPDTAGNYISKIQIQNNTPAQISPPSADVSPGTGLVAIYNCRQTVGVASQLTDTSGNAYHLTNVGPNGLFINAFGPYAS